MKVNSENIVKTVFDLVLSFSKMIKFNEEAENLKTMELYVLFYIAQKGPQRMSDLAKTFSMTKSNVTVLVDGLEAKGLVRRKRSDEDRRVVYVQLTDKGNEVYGQILNGLLKLIDEVISEIPERDLEMITDGFNRLSKLFVRGEGG